MTITKLFLEGAEENGFYTLKMKILTPNIPVILALFKYLV